MPVARWRQALEEHFAVTPEVSKNVEKPVKNALQKAVMAFVQTQTDDHRNAVLRLLQIHGISSALVEMRRCQLGHEQYEASQESRRIRDELASEEEEQERYLLHALRAWREKFGIDLPQGKANPRKCTFEVGKSWILSYSTSGGGVDWTLIDPLTQCQVKIYAGDPPERLGSALTQLAQLKQERLKESFAAEIAAQSGESETGEPVRGFLGCDDEESENA